MSEAFREWVKAQPDSEYTDLKVSLIYIVGTLLAAEVTRLCVKWVLKDPQNLARRLFMEGLAAGELCAACFELGVIVDNYGVWYYALVLFSISCWWSHVWQEASACPYTHVEDVMTGHTGYRMALLIIFIEVLAGVSSYPFYVKKFWLYKFIPMHASRIYQNRCPADLTLPAWQGAMVEGMATCICQLTGRVMSRFRASVSNVVVSFVGVMLVVAAFELSGGYYNPVLATALQWNCGEVSRQDHVIVYWVGSIGGAMFSVLLWNHRSVHSYLTYGPPKVKTE